ncbi:MAG: 50S ribosomal protein L10 [Deltaproteobacteria bacterium]|nr:50S ribosomal protein L10 [Deltaproteobacteria bacterium]
MNRAEKSEMVEEIRTQIMSTPLVVLTDFKGSTVQQMDTLRRSFEERGVQYRVVKNTLCRRAIEGTEHEPLAAFLRGNTGLVFSGEDPSDAAKVLKEQIKGNKNLVVKAGVLEGDLLDGAGVIAVADLPSREELMVMLLRTLQEAPRRVMGVIRAPARDLLYLLQNYANKLEEAD